jgi:SAM-dependent methyltransferase
VSKDRSDDVPSSIDLRDKTQAYRWVAEAELKRPWREELRGRLVELLCASSLPVRRVLEIGSGPGLLAEAILRSSEVEQYTLFDLSRPMLKLSRERVGHHPAATFVLGDFREHGWTEALAAPFDAVVAMQAVHEIRHKRHVAGLYREVHNVLRPGGLLLVCDHVPIDASERMTSLHSTEAEQHAALNEAGFARPTTHMVINGLYLCGGDRELRSPQRDGTP